MQVEDRLAGFGAVELDDHDAGRVHRFLHRGGDLLGGRDHTLQRVGRRVEKADARALDASCLDTLAYPTPFISFNGAEP